MSLKRRWAPGFCSSEPSSSPMTFVSTHRLPPSLGDAHTFKDPNGMNVVIVCC